MIVSARLSRQNGQRGRSSGRKHSHRQTLINAQSLWSHLIDFRVWSLGGATAEPALTANVHTPSSPPSPPSSRPVSSIIVHFPSTNIGWPCEFRKRHLSQQRNIYECASGAFSVCCVHQSNNRFACWMYGMRFHFDRYDDDDDNVVESLP